MPLPPKELLQFTDNERAIEQRLKQRTVREDLNAFIEHIGPLLLGKAPGHVLVTRIEFIDGKPYRSLSWVDESRVAGNLFDDRGYLHLLYLTICTVNSKLYIGKMSRSLTRINKYYVGSGRSLNGGAITDAIKKYGKENFERLSICFCATDDEIFELEAIAADFKWIRRPDTYNQVPGGRGVGSGEDHPLSDKTIYRFIDLKNCQFWDLTQLEAQESLKLEQTRVSDIVHNVHSRSGKLICAGPIASIVGVDVEICIARHKEERAKRKEEKRRKISGVNHYKYDDTVLVFYNIETGEITRAPAFVAEGIVGLTPSEMTQIKLENGQARKRIIYLGKSEEITSQQEINEAIAKHLEIRSIHHEKGRKRRSESMKAITKWNQDSLKYVFIHKETAHTYLLTKKEAVTQLGIPNNKIIRILRYPHLSAKGFISPGSDIHELYGYNAEQWIQNHMDFAASLRRSARVKAASKMLGQNNPSYDPTIYRFKHPSGEIWKGTVSEFITLHPELHPTSIRNIATGISAQLKTGWTCLNPKNPCARKKSSLP